MIVTTHMKRFACCLLALVLALAVVALPGKAFAQSGTYVFDERELLTSDQFSQLEATATNLANEYNMGVYFYTTSTMGGLSDPSSSERTDFAVNFYKKHGLGLNKGENAYGDGIMLVLAADSRDYVTIAYGQGSYSFSDSGIESMESQVKSKLKSNDWYGGASVYYQCMEEQLAYYASHGKAQQALKLSDILIRLAIILLVPLIITFVVINGWRKQMKTAVEQSEASNYLDAQSVQITHSNDRFVNTTMTVTPRPKKSDSDSGGWGGGGGGGFSSSGGGKF